VQRYNILSAGGRGGYAPVDADALDDAGAAELARRLLQAARLAGWQIGKTRVFLRAGQLAQLEGARGRRLTASAVAIQAAFRALAARRQLARERAAATRIAAAWRGHAGRRLAAAVRRERAATRIAAAWRRHVARAAFRARQADRRATRVQAHVRGYLTRARFRKATELGRRQAARAAALAARHAAATAIQAHVRGRIARRKARRRRPRRPSSPPAGPDAKKLCSYICALSGLLHAVIMLGLTTCSACGRGRRRPRAHGGHGLQRRQSRAGDCLATQPARITLAQTCQGCHLSPTPGPRAGRGAARGGGALAGGAGGPGLPGGPGAPPPRPGPSARRRWSLLGCFALGTES